MTTSSLKTDIQPTVHKELAPFNYKRVRRLSRMSGVPENMVHVMFLKEFARIQEEHNQKNPGLNDVLTNAPRITPEMVKELYDSVTKKLGVANESLTVGKQAIDFSSLSKVSHGFGVEGEAENKSLFVSTSKLRGFNIEIAEKYLKEVGYSTNFISRLKNSSTIRLIHMPKHLNAKLKTRFEKFFEMQMLTSKHQAEHAVVFYARTVAAFITEVSKTEDPFDASINLATTLPVSALKSLYRYKFDVVARYANAIQGFRYEKSEDPKVSLIKVSQRKFQNFNVTGEIHLIPKSKIAPGSTYTKNFNESIAKLSIADKLRKGPVVMQTQKRVTLSLSIKGDKEPLLVLRYRIDITPQFSTDGLSDVSDWIKRYVVLPNLKHFKTNANFQRIVK